MCVWVGFRWRGIQGIASMWGREGGLDRFRWMGDVEWGLVVWGDRGRRDWWAVGSVSAQGGWEWFWCRVRFLEAVRAGLSEMSFFRKGRYQAELQKEGFLKAGGEQKPGMPRKALRRSHRVPESPSLP